MNAPTSNPDPGRLNWADYIDHLRRSARSQKTAARHRTFDWAVQEGFDAPLAQTKVPPQPRRPT
jgi:hypothetical protein